MSKVDIIKKFAGEVLAAENMEIGNPLVMEEITFVPIIKHEIPREERDYLTLSEALQEKVCKIVDKGTEVAHIVFDNLGNLPILIEEGEIFKGEGTQDRMSVATVMVEPTSHMEIGVKCVHAPHGLASGAYFGYGGKASRSMLGELRSMKFANAMQDIPAFAIDQGRVWNKVSEENTEELSTQEPQYIKSVEKRQKRAKKRTKKVEFPKNTVGVVVINADGDFKGFEIHRSPHNFDVRKDGIFESLEANISWDAKGKGPIKEPKRRVSKLFEKLSQLKEGKDAMGQVEVEGLAINMDGISGEAYTATFYSDNCPGCNTNKPRKKICPHCGFSEEDSDEMAYMSLF
jgi:hypothetical protein